MRLLTSLVALSLLSFGGSPGATSAHATVCRPSLPNAIRHALGLPPHQTWAIPTDRRWFPLAVNRGRALVVRQSTRSRGRAGAEPRPIRMALLHFGSPRIHPLPAGAYPHRGVLGSWQLEGDWIVGIISSRPVPGPPSWILWAGNIRTGASIVLDTAAQSPDSHYGEVDFALSGGRVVWNDDLILPGFTFKSRIAMYDLRSRRRTFLTPFQRGAIDGRIALAGSRIIWERETPLPTSVSQPTMLYDLMTRNLRTGVTGQLSHSSIRSGSSMMPSLEVSLLLFLHGTSMWSGGSIILVDLAQTVPGRHAFWWQAHQHRIVGTGDYPSMAGGLASWRYGLLFDLHSSITWRFPGRDAQWLIGALGGGNAVIETQRRVQLWRVPNAQTANACSS